jgi:hypothetical protein
VELVLGNNVSNLIRIRYNTMAAETPGGEWKWRVVEEASQGYKETLAKRLTLNVPSFTTEDDMPVVGRKYHIACYGRFRLEGDGSGVIDPL